jgi:hypothetical protein
MNVRGHPRRAFQRIEPAGGRVELKKVSPPADGRGKARLQFRLFVRAFSRAPVKFFGRNPGELSPVIPLNERQ